MLKQIVSGIALTLLLISVLISLSSPEFQQHIGHFLSGQGESSSQEQADVHDDASQYAENQSINIERPLFLIIPSNVTVNVGQSLPVSIEVRNAPNVTQFILKLTWNPAVLQIINNRTDITEGDFLKRSLYSTIFLFINRKPGEIEEVTCAILDDVYVNGNGTLCTITFRAIASGASSIHLDSGLLLLDPQKTYGVSLQDSSVTVLPSGPLPPIAHFTYSLEPKVGLPMVFDASGSTPNEGEIVSYEWNFGDGHHALGKTAKHTYVSPNEYIVTLNVTDSEGLWDIEQKLIEVAQAWTGPIYIRANGSIDPPTAPMKREGNTYVLTINIITNDVGIVIEKDGIIMDGAGYTVQDPVGPFGDATGILLAETNVTIKNIEILGCCAGIGLEGSNNSIVGNNIMNNDIGISMANATNNRIVGNNIATSKAFGIILDKSSNNRIVENNITANEFGIVLQDSSNNSIYHNNFINNRNDVHILDSINTWDSGYASRGNYWSNYVVTDSKKGPNQNVTGSDGIGDTPYIICADNVDQYPLTNPYAVACAPIEEKEQS